MQCIYSKKRESDCTFNKSEHIFPKTVGGMKTLPKGYVSDEINEYFGKELEYQFSRQYPLTEIAKMCLPPIGRKKHKNLDKISLIRLHSFDRFELGYVEAGVPKAIDQIIVDITSINSDIIIESVVSEPNKYESSTDKIVSLLTFIKEFDCKHKYQIKQFSELPTNYLSIGKYYDYLIVACNPNIDRALLMKYLSKIISYLNSKKIEIHSDKKFLSRVSFKKNSKFDLDNIKRLYLKTAFNCLSYLYTNHFVLDKRFDKFREAVLNGEDIDRFIVLNTNSSDYLYLIDNIKSRNSVSDYSNIFLILPPKDGILSCILSILGTHISFISFNLEADYFDNITPKGYLCDPENKLEFSLYDGK